MEQFIFSSPAIAKEMKKIYGSSAKVIKIDMCHEDEVRKYVTKIEKAHKKAAESKLTFH